MTVSSGERRLLVLLPPSETKRDGGSAVSGPPWKGLSWPELDETRAATARALIGLAADPAAHDAALKLRGALGAAERARNAALATAPRMSALERYTGVLYDGLDEASLPDDARAWARERMAVQSACFGLVRAGDRIPAYRASCSSRIGGRSMSARWAGLVAGVLERHEGPILDLRSGQYAALGPLPERADAIAVEVATRTSSGELAALNHFNKRGKGLLARALAVSAGGDAALAARLDGARTGEELAGGLRQAIGAAGAPLELCAQGERGLLVIAPDPRARRASEATHPA